MTFPPSRKIRKTTKLALLIGAIVTVTAGTCTAVALGSNAAYAAETRELCSAAMDETNTATRHASSALTKADSALVTVGSTELPDEAGTSNVYGAPSHNATEHVDGADNGNDDNSRRSDYIVTLMERRDHLAAANAAAECTERDQAAELLATAQEIRTAAEALEQATSLMLDDFADFQESEAQRIAEKNKAAEKAAAAEAAAEDAARLAAEQASAEQAAWKTQQQFEPAPSQEWTQGHEVRPVEPGDWSSPPPADQGSNGGGGQFVPPNASELGVCPPGMNCAV